MAVELVLVELLRHRVCEEGCVHVGLGPVRQVDVAQEDELVGGARVGDELDVRLLRQGDEVRILERGLEREVARLENEGGVEAVG